MHNTFDNNTSCLYKRFNVYKDGAFRILSPMVYIIYVCVCTSMQQSTPLRDQYRHTHTHTNNDMVTLTPPPPLPPVLSYASASGGHYLCLHSFCAHVLHHCILHDRSVVPLLNRCTGAPHCHSPVQLLTMSIQSCSTINIYAASDQVCVVTRPHCTVSSLYPYTYPTLDMQHGVFMQIIMH